MRIKSIKIHNFRSIKEAKFDPHDYTVLVGANNAGKSNILAALRIFYENGIKFNENSDLPQFQRGDDESWIEIEYLLTNEEFGNLKDEYRNPSNILKVRKYLKSEDKNKVKANQSNIYAYEKDVLSENLFYGAKNISEAKLGSVVYIPEVTTTAETMKLTGDSPLRDVITFTMKKVVKTSESFENLNKAFENLDDKFKVEESKDGFSLSKLKREINDSLEQWDVEFDLAINPARPEDIIRNLVSYCTKDKKLGKEIDVKYMGQGLQRHLIYTLIKLSSQYTERKIYEKKEFSPEFTLILFEEPEAFLHPGQQESLNAGLRSLSCEEGQQVVVATHSPIFVSKNIEDIAALIKLRREENGITQVFQVSENTQMTLIQQNNELAQLLQAKLSDPSVAESTKNKIREMLGETDDDTRMEEEAIRYLLWLNPERCSAFFADIVLICEGATEKVFIDYLIENKWNKLREKKIYILDAMGKFNIHRYMNLFKELGICHSILADEDENQNVHGFINQFISEQKNPYTKSVDFFHKDMETFLGISSPPNTRRDKKPLNVIWHYSKGKISGDKIDALKDKVESLL